MTRLLLLAGTTEAADLARRLADERPDLEVTASFAGRVRDLGALPVATRVGGFGGAAGLAEHLRATATDLLVDATHPFAAVLPFHAEAAARTAGVPRLRLLRPPWSAGPGDEWHEVADLDAAAAAVDRLGAGTAFLTTGRHEVAPFARLAGARFVLRAIDPPTDLPLAADDVTVVLDRGPFDVDAEEALLRTHAVDVVVTRNSGGSATAAKLVAARRLGLPVVLVSRPPQPLGPQVADVDAALAWIAEHAPASSGG